LADAECVFHGRRVGHAMRIPRFHERQKPMISHSEKLIYAWPLDGKFALPFQFERAPVKPDWSARPHMALTGRICVTFPNGATVSYSDFDHAQRAVDMASECVWS